MKETSNSIERSYIWQEIYDIVKKIPMEKVTGDAMDYSSASTELEKLFNKYLKEFI